MKLRGTRTESAIRDRLVASNLSIKSNVKIMEFLQKNTRLLNLLTYSPARQTRMGIYMKY